MTHDSGGASRISGISFWRHGKQTQNAVEYTFTTVNYIILQVLKLSHKFRDFL